jgi:hypothetical protein
LREAVAHATELGPTRLFANRICAPYIDAGLDLGVPVRSLVSVVGLLNGLASSQASASHVCDEARRLRGQGCSSAHVATTVAAIMKRSMLTGELAKP